MLRHHDAREPEGRATDLVTGGILDVDDVECSGVALTVDEGANTTSAAASSHKHLSAQIELQVLNNLA